MKGNRNGVLQEQAEALSASGGTSFPAKLTRPQLARAYARSRLHTLLDGALQTANAAWLEALPGAGKTTLAASWLDLHQRPCLWYQVDAGDTDLPTFFQYLVQAAKLISPQELQTLPYLTPEYAFGVEIYARRFFEELYRRLPPGSIFVLDNCQEAGADSPLHNILRIAIETLPAHVKLLCISRASPPAALARLRANGQLALVDAGQFSLTADEALGIAALRGHDDANVVHAIQAQTHGWAAGLVLMLETDARSTGAAQDTQELFNYFAGEVLLGLDALALHTLLVSALLPQMRLSELIPLTGNPDVGKLLLELQQRNYFTYRRAHQQQQDAVYEYHPLFRDFLLKRLHETTPSEKFIALKSQAAALLAAAGQSDEATSLWMQAKDWAPLIVHILKQAPQLLTEGRMHVVETWFAALPEELVGSQPWLLYWRGACRRMSDPLRARTDFEHAYTLFEPAGDLAGQCEAWASIVDTFNVAWGDMKPLDRWIAEMDRLLAADLQFPSPQAAVRVAAGMLSALTYRAPARADLPRWGVIVESFVLMDGGPPGLRIMLGQVLAYYFLVSGNFPKLAVLIEALKPLGLASGYDPAVRQFWFVMEAMCTCLLADWEACQEAVSRGIANAQEHGVHLYNLPLLGQGVYGGVSLGGLAAAERFLDMMSQIDSPRPGDKAFFHNLASAVSWCRGDLQTSIEHSRQAVRIGIEIGWVFVHMLYALELACSLFDNGEHEEAERWLMHGTAPGCAASLEFMGNINGARFAFERGDTTLGDARLTRALQMGSKLRFANMPRWHNERMARLLARALERGIETEYVLWLINKRKLLPPSDMPVPETWPMPVRVHTLGRFSIFRNGEPLSFSGKAQKKPIELLKVLIALGGRDVPAGKLVDALWPESEGDAGHGALKMAILRLRQLLGSDDIILSSGGALTLDSRLCHVDAFAFELMAEQAEEMPPPEFGKKLLACYRGRLLPAESGLSWSYAMRERLQAKFMRMILRLGRTLEAEGPLEAAVELYQEALEVDDLCEEFYQRLMSCFLKLGQQSAVIATYQRCHKVLVHGAGTAISDVTELLHLAAQGQRA